MLAVIRENIVINLVEGDQSSIGIVYASYPNDQVVEVPEDQLISAAIGSSYIDGEFLLPEPIIPVLSEEQIAENVRNQRNALLQKSDIKMLYDNWNSMSTTLKGKWTAYRQALRDIPLQEGFPQEVTWPQEP